ncbi:hypothetical protein D9M70_498560 [compost metagenome]
MPFAKDDRFLLVPDVIAGRHHVGAGVDRLEKDVFGDAETAGRILAVDDDEIELEVTNQSWKPLPDRRTARLAHHISQKQKPHARSNPTRAARRKRVSGCCVRNCVKQRDRASTRSRPRRKRLR